jgi:hypothetical protein
MGSRPSSVVERVAFNHVVLGSIPTADGVYQLDKILELCFFGRAIRTGSFEKKGTGPKYI